MSGSDWIAQQRLRQQRLLGNPAATPQEVVAWLGAVQAQEYAGAKWSLAMRLPEKNATDSAIEQACDDGLILRTHVLRPTWHFVAPRDIRSLLSLTAPHVHKVSGTMYRRVQLDGTLLRRSQAVLVEALQGGRSATRDELADALAGAGIEAVRVRLAYILMAAELDALICSGPRRGKQFTYMLLDERAPGARSVERDEALAELTRRYFRGHGPATERDYAWWSGLKLADVRRGIDIAGRELVQEAIDGTSYWFTPSDETPASGGDTAFLLPTYDEFFMGFAGATRPAGVDPHALVFDSTIVAGGKIAGTWRRQFEKGIAAVEVVALPPFTADDPRLAAAAVRYAAFLQMPVEVRAVNESELKTTGWRRSRQATLDTENKGD